MQEGKDIKRREKEKEEEEEKRRKDKEDVRKSYVFYER